MSTWKDRLIEAVKSQMAAKAHTQHQAAVAMGMTSQSQFNDLLHGRQPIGVKNCRRMLDYARLSEAMEHRILRECAEDVTRCCLSRS